MALLDQSQAAMPMQEEPMEDPAMAAEPPTDEEGSGELTVTPDAITEQIFKNADEDLQNDIKIVVNAGMKLLFGEKTHKTLFDGIRPGDQVPLADELGAGATNLMAQMYDASTQQGDPIPEQAIVPAGVILLAAVCEHIKEVQLDEVTDQTFADAVEMFIYSIQDKFDPEFRQKNGLPPSPAQQQMADAQQPEAPPEEIPQGADAAAAIGPGAQAVPGLLGGMQ